jgi:hypothetical protein
MASSSRLPLSEANTESQPQSLPETFIDLGTNPMPNIDWKTLSSSQRAEELRKYLNNDLTPNFDGRAIPPAVPERKFDVSQRVEELHKYLHENTYPTHQKNIMAAIEMYNRKELPKPDTNFVHIRDGKLIEVTVDLDAEPIWIEVRFKTTG